MPAARSEHYAPRAQREKSEFWGNGFAVAARFEALLRIAKDPAPFVMKLRQNMAREQGRHATGIVVRMMHAPSRMERYLSDCIERVFADAISAARRIYRGDG